LGTVHSLRDREKLETSIDWLQDADERQLHLTDVMSSRVSNLAFTFGIVTIMCLVFISLQAMAFSAVQITFARSYAEQVRLVGHAEQRIVEDIRHLTTLNRTLKLAEQVRLIGHAGQNDAEGICVES